MEDWYVRIAEMYSRWTVWVKLQVDVIPCI